MTETPILCDCCGTETMAKVRDGKLIIISRRHGRTHVVALPLDRTIDKVSKADIKSA